MRTFAVVRRLNCTEAIVLIGYAVGHFMPVWLPQAPKWLVYVASAIVVSIPITAAVSWVNVMASDQGAPVNVADRVSGAGGREGTMEEGR